MKKDPAARRLILAHTSPRHVYEDMGRCRIALVRRSAEGDKLLGHSAAPSVCCKRLCVWIGDGLGTHGCEYRSCLAQAVNFFFFSKTFFFDWIFLYSKLNYLKFDFSKIGLRP